MGDRPSQDLKPARGLQRIAEAAGYLLGALLPVAVTLFVMVLRARFSFPSFVFLYLPPLLMVAYLGGLAAAALGAVVTTSLVTYFLIEPQGLSLPKLQAEGPIVLAFLGTSVLVAAAGSQYRFHRRRAAADMRRVRQRMREDQLLIAVSTLVASRQESGSPYLDVCARIAADLGEWCALMIAEGEELHLAAFGGPDPSLGPPHGLTESLEAAETRWPHRIIEAGDAVAVAGRGGESAPGDGDAVAWLKRHDLAGMLAAPLRLGADRLGLLAVLARRPRPWDEETLRLVEVLAGRIALAVHRDRVAAETARRERERALLDALMVELAADRDLDSTLQTVVRRCTESLGDWCGISLLDPLTRTLPLTAVYHRDPAKVARIREIVASAPTSAEDPWTAQVLAGRTPVEVYADDPRIQELMPNSPVVQEIIGRLGVTAILYGPIHYRDTPLGTFSVAVETGRRWRQEDVRLAAEIAERTGVAIQNARLREAERAARTLAERESARVSAVSRVITMTAATIDLGAVYDELAEALQILLPFTRVTVSLYDHDRQWLTMPYFTGPELAAPPQRLVGPKAGTARGHVIDTGRPFVRTDTLEVREFEEDDILGGAGIRSYLIVPMNVGGRPVGTLNFGHIRPGFYTEEHARLIRPIADQLALTVEHARLFERQRRLASELSETIQRALLPRDLPEIPFAALGAFYRPADPEGKVGGDWYDALLLPDDRLLVSVGDVVGHGLAAASTMGQARHIIRAYALEERGPAQILTALNQALGRLPETPHLTAWVGMIDPFTGALDHSTAGSPPPHLLSGGRVTPLNAGGPPLGSSPGFPYVEEHMMLRPGTRLVAYTDGLIEVTRDATEGERRLREALAATAAEPPSTAGEALIRMIVQTEEPHDDIALLILDLLPEEAPLTLALQASPANLRRVRRAVRTLAERQGMTPQRAEEIVLAVGEAALNAVEHAYLGRPGRLSVRGERAGEMLTVSVRDFGRWRPPQDQGRGRGTGMMRGSSDDFKVYTSPAGTLVEISWRLSERPAASS